MRPLSYSSISMYSECPLKYKLKYIDGLKERPRPYLSFGSSLHSALEFLYFRKAVPTLDELLRYFEEKWIAEGYSNKEEEEGYFSYGKRILSKYFEKHARDIRPPLAVEHRFDLEVKGVPVTGFIDRVDRIKGGKAEIIDYKSGKRPFSASQVRDNEQLTFYQWAVEETLHIPVGKLTLYHLPSQKAVSSKPRPNEKIDKLKGKVLLVAHLIDEGEFEPKRNRFCPCDFGENCPLFEHLYGKTKKKRRKQQSLSDFGQ